VSEGVVYAYKEGFLKAQFDDREVKRRSKGWGTDTMPSRLPLLESTLTKEGTKSGSNWNPRGLS
jgi:hypothetical protein